MKRRLRSLLPPSREAPDIAHYQWIRRSDLLILIATPFLVPLLVILAAPTWVWVSTLATAVLAAVDFVRATSRMRGNHGSLGDEDGQRGPRADLSDRLVRTVEGSSGQPPPSEHDPLRRSRTARKAAQHGERVVAFDARESSLYAQFRPFRSFASQALLPLPRRFLASSPDQHV